MQLHFPHAVFILVGVTARLHAAAAQDNATVASDGCSICPEGEVMTRPDTILRENTAGFTEANDTCQDIQGLATDGSFSTYQCSLLNASSVASTCGCGQPTAEGQVTEPPEGTSGDAKMHSISVALAAGLCIVTTMLLN